MRLDQSRARKALIVVYWNDYFTLTQHFKHKMKKYLYDCRTQIVSNYFCTRHGKPSSRSLERWLVSYSIVSLRHWSSWSFFPVIGWKAFGISLAWVEHLRALFQFWSDNILHCHLERGKLKQPFLFFLSNTSREFFNELNMISVSFDVTVSRLFNYLHHWMVAVGMFCLFIQQFLFESRETHATNKSDAKLKPITTWSPAFSRA